MRRLACECCCCEYPTSDVIDVQGRILCKTCHSEFVESHPDCAAESKRVVDLTICSRCGSDQGSTECESLLGAPCCPTCVDFFRNRPYPTWVKLFFGAVAFSVLFSCAWNWRFLQGRFNIKAAFAAAGRGQLETAADRMATAAAEVPESAELREFAAYFEGIDRLNKNQCEKAEACFAKCSRLDKEWNIATLRQHAAIGAAFDRKDYWQFLKLSEQYAEEHRQDAVAVAQVASALACLYAVEGVEDWRAKAEAKLDEAKALGGDMLTESRYEERIRYRLKTREIIDSEEYAKRFPETAESQEEPKP